MSTPTKNTGGKGKGRSARVSAGRNITTRVKTARGRKSSSTRWLKRQLNDPYVAEANRLGYRSRSAFKLIELDDRFRFLKRGLRIIDLGAAPGGWSQIAAERVGRGGQVVGIDLREIDPIPGAELIVGDFLDDDALARLTGLLGGKADIVLSDMAAAATGHTATDHMRIMLLLEAAIEFAGQVLAPGGTFIGKVLQGGTENQLLVLLKNNFRSVKHAKPPSSRNDSAEMYVVASGFRGTNED